MYISNKNILECSEGEILAADVFNCEETCLLAAKDTVLNHYILEHLKKMGINILRIYVNTDNEFHLKYIMLTKLIKSIFHEMMKGNPVDCAGMKAIFHELNQPIQENNNILRCVLLIREKDGYTFYHSINVAFYAMLLGKWLQLSDTMIYDAILAGLLHDIGKIKIPKKILNKTGALSKEEFEVIKKHTIYGYELVKDFDFLNSEVKDAILLHHERLDGTGYPFHYTSKKINLYARIVAIADVFDAMTSERVYKRRTTPFEVFRVFLNEEPEKFDQDILQVFMKNLAQCLIGSRILLNDGRLGDIVYIPFHNLMDPIVRMADEYIDLSTEANLRIEMIV